jgi:hypothetical protein
MGGASDYTAGHQASTTSDRWGAMPELHRKVLHIVESNTSDDGVHVAEIARAVSGTTADEIM